MPTTRPRHFVTETDELARALDAAALRWPGLSRAQLLVRLALEAGARTDDLAEQQRQRRLDAIREQRGALTGMYGADYLESLRADWPS